MSIIQVKELPLDIDQVNVTEYLQGILQTCVQRKGTFLFAKSLFCKCI